MHTDTFVWHRFWEENRHGVYQPPKTESRILNSSIWCFQNACFIFDTQIYLVSSVTQAFGSSIWFRVHDNNKNGLKAAKVNLNWPRITSSCVQYYVLLCKLDTCMHNLSCKFLSNAAAFERIVNLCLYQSTTVYGYKMKLKLKMIVWVLKRFAIE